MTNIQTDKSKLARVAVQVGCGSFAAMMLGTTATIAEVVNPEDTMSYGSVGLTADDSSFKFDLDGDGTNDFKIFDTIKRATIDGIFTKGKGIFGKAQIANELFKAGETVDDSASFDADQCIFGCEGDLGLGAGKTAFLGLKLTISTDVPDETPEIISVRYGWVEITRGSVTAGRTGVQTMSGLGAPIPDTAPVPLPASLPLLALGVGGLAALRRKRKAA